MSNLTIATTAPGSADPNPSMLDNPAVVRCCTAWQQAYDAKFAQCGSKLFAGLAASQAYRDSMPILAGYENISNFIACTAQGILIGAIDSRKSSTLLYAAQVALSLISRRSSPEKPG